MSTALVGTVAKTIELSGNYKICVLSCPVASASDTVAISFASHGVTYVDYIIGATITAGMDALLMSVEPSITSTTQVTLKTYGAAGLAAADWTGANVELAFIGH